MNEDMKLNLDELDSVLEEKVIDENGKNTRRKINVFLLTVMILTV